MLSWPDTFMLSLVLLAFLIWQRMVHLERRMFGPLSDRHLAELAQKRQLLDSIRNHSRCNN